MLFNSKVFFLFFATFYVVYLASHRSLRLRNVVILAGSALFYGWWDWRFLALLAVSTLVDFHAARAIHRIDEAGDSASTTAAGNQAAGNPAATLRNIRRRRRWLIASIVANLGILSVFKYLDFFAASAADLFNVLGMKLDPVTLGIVLPVGVSFYTFQSMSYTIDVYRRQIKPTRSLLDFAVYVSFFPQLVAGPIERASHLLPQIQSKRTITAGDVNDAAWLLIYGYFLKVFVADNLATVVTPVFDDPAAFGGFDLILAVCAFAGQIYGDFAGYSRIARGLAKLMGFDLMVNFRLPYFAISPSDFWRRWHISLSTWLRDYLYISLGGNRKGATRTHINLALTMLLGGLWHGASWNFVLWGAFHGLILIVYRIAGSWSDAKPAVVRLLRTPPIIAVRWAVMLVLTLFGWLLFRATNVEQISYFITHAGFDGSPTTRGDLQLVAMCLLPVVLIESTQQATGNLLVFAHWPWPLRAAAYGLLAATTMALGQRESMEFIYFQF